MPSLEDLSVDQLLARARETEGSHALLSTLMRDPETRERAQRALKKANPNLVIPEIDAADRFRETEIKPTVERIAKLEAEILESKVRTRMEKQRSDVAAKYHLSEADLLEVEKLMTAKEDAIPSYDAAARVFKASQQSAIPTASSLSPPTFQMPEQDIWGKGIGNKAALDKIGMDEAYKALNDIRSGRVAGLGPAVTN